MDKVTSLLRSYKLRCFFWLVTRAAILSVMWWKFACVVSSILFHYVWDMASIGWWMTFISVCPFVFLSWLLMEYRLFKKRASVKTIWISSALFLFGWMSIASIWVIAANYNDITIKIFGR